MLPEITEIKKRRKLADLTQKEIAVLAGVSQSLIAKIESNKVKPTYENVKRIVKALDEFEKEDRVIAKDIMNRNVVYVKKEYTVEKVINIMNRTNYSQLPVLERGYSVGAVTEMTIFDVVSSGKKLSDIFEKKIGHIMEESFPTIKKNESMDIISALLKDNHAVLVTRKGKVSGIITKADMFKVAKKK